MRIEKIWGFATHPGLTLMLGAATDGAKRVFLCVDLRQQTGGWSLLLAKPEGLAPQPKGPVPMLRRVLQGRCVTLCHLGEGELLLAGRSAESEMWLELVASKPPLLRLAVDGWEILRFSQAGTFTKKRTVEHGPKRGDPEASRQAWLKALNELQRPEAILPPDTAYFDATLRRRLVRRLRTLRAAAAKAASHLPSPAQLAVLDETAELLRQFGSLHQPGSSQLQIPAELLGSDRDRVLPLERHEQIGSAIESAQHKAKTGRRALHIGQPRLNALQEEMTQLERAIAEFSELGDLGAYTDWAQRVATYLPARQPAPREARTAAAAPGRIVTGPDQIPFRVSRNATDGDALLRTAAGNDFWFHVGAHRGSHVILAASELGRRGLSRDLLPPKLKHFGCVVALYFSRLRDTGRGDIQVSQRRFLRKTRHHREGQWDVQRADVVACELTLADITLLRSHSEGD